MDSTISERGGSDLSKTSIFTTRYPHNDDNVDGTTKSRFTTHSQIQLQVRTFATPPTIQKTFKFYIHENVRYDGDMKNCNSSLDPCFLMDHALAFVTSDVTQNLQQQTGRIRIQFYLMTNVSSSYYCHNSLEESSGKFTYEIHVFAFEPLDQQRPQVHCQGAGLIKNSQQVVKLTFNNLTLYDTFIGMSFNSVSDDALIEINSCTLNGPGRQASVIISSRGANLRIVHSQLSSMNVASKEGIMVFEKSIISDSFLDFIDTTSIIFTACTLDRSTGIQSAGSSVHMEFCTLHHVPEFNVEKFSFVALHQCSLTNTRLLISFGNEFVIQFSNVTGSNNLFTVKGVVSVIIQHNNIYDTDVSPLETDSRAIFDMVLSDYVYVYQTNIIGSPRRAIYIDEANTIFFRESNFINNRGGIFINKLVRFTSGVERNVVRIWSCLFMNNTVSGGDGGAANIPKADVIHIYSSTFIDNTAANGGAIYLNQGSAEVDNCTFSNNVARLVTGVTIGKTGNGGAIYLKDMDYINIGNTNFIQNRAIRGGAVYMLKEKDSGFNDDIRFNLNCMDNTATYLGHCFYSEQSVPLFRYLNFTKIRGSQVGNYQVATSFISLTGWSFSKNATQTRESKLSLYPGQVISIYFGIVDYFGQNITNLQQQPILMVNDDVLSTVSFSRNNISIERLYFEIRDESVKHFNFSVAFPGTSMSVTFEVNVQDCLPGFILSTISASRLICQKDVAWPIIIPLIVVGSLLVFALGIFIGIGLLYCGWRIASRLRRLNQREKAEKKLEKKLLDKKFIFSEDHIELSSDLQTKLLDSYIDPTDSSGSGGKKDKKPQKKDTFIIPIDSIDVIKKIGEGANGIVYLGKWSGTDVALKSLKFDNSNDSNQDNEEFETEAALLSDLRHPSIVNFFGVAMSQSVKYMVVEFLSKGSLDKAIYNSKIGKEILSLETKISILKSVSSGMSYLHSLKPYAIIHRDLKPANILLDGAMNAKVSDFGLSKLVSTNATATMTTNLGTLFYMSPEILGDSDENSITTKLDVYSFAIIMYELFFEENPYLNIHSEKIHRFTSPDISDKSCFNIPAKVIKGLRPKIPFSNEEEQRVWISEYIRPREHYLDNDDLFELTSQYLHLMIQCWSGKSQHRPDFSSVTTTLSNMYNKFFD
ncbi:hypothetical protein C9374_007969 [Naegleria lovaniensis]|uniref:non-specific serine/threonine protein kinase n=1 Tax=Naegleria lovaniensis TaxID=51637 RepID=A0AA88KI30_NAELO|nr:uncharacterized protein C9374_007969 [Naegleria lovaniensis]KAG2378821.1 hypothetical protein C9374_007969 [Naegleria lovaniensis]